MPSWSSSIDSAKWPTSSPVLGLLTPLTRHDCSSMKLFVSTASRGASCRIGTSVSPAPFGKLYGTSWEQPSNSLPPSIRRRTVRQKSPIDRWETSCAVSSRKILLRGTNSYHERSSPTIHHTIAPRDILRFRLTPGGIPTCPSI